MPAADTFFSFFRSPKISSEKVALEPTLFPHVTESQTLKDGSGTATFRFTGGTIISVKSDGLQPKTHFFRFYPFLSR